MLFQSSIRRELARSFGATFVVLITLVLTIVLIRTLGQASRGIINPQDVMLFMAYSALGRLPTILTLSLFIAMVGTLSRMYRDSEMVVWFTSGQGLASFAPPLFRFAWPVLLIIGLSALFIWPWTNLQTKDMKARYEGRSDLDRIAPGQFQESSNGNRVFFIDRNANTDEKSSSNVFISSSERGKNSVTTAQSGRIETNKGKQVLILENGQRLESETGKASLKISYFEAYGNTAGDAAQLNTDTNDAKFSSITELVKTPSRGNLSELGWRVGLALAAVNFVLLALGLANANPRGGRSINLALVVLTFLVYNNLINLGQSWVLGGRIGLGVLIMVLHGGVFAISLALLAKRHNHWTLRAALRPRRPSAQSQLPITAFKGVP